MPLLHLADGDNVVLVASQGGLPSDPQWYRNIVADPHVEVEFRGHDACDARAHGRRRPNARRCGRGWSTLYADFESYQSWTDREIPVVICEPA